MACIPFIGNSDGLPDTLSHTIDWISIVHVPGKVANVLMPHETEFVSVDVGHIIPQLVLLGHWPQLVALIL